MSYHTEKQSALSFLERTIEIIESCANLRNMNDEDIAINLFEGDSGSVDDARFCFNAADLPELTENWLISDEVYEKLLSLGDRLNDISFNSRKKWTVEAVRTDSEWTDIIEMANKIKSLLTIND